MRKLFIVEDPSYANINDSKYLDVEFNLESTENSLYRLVKSQKSEYYHDDFVKIF